MYLCARARARVHALCVLSGTFVGVSGIFVGVRVCVRRLAGVRTHVRAHVCMPCACVRVHICTHIIFIPIVQLYNCITMPRFVY